MTENNAPPFAPDAEAEKKYLKPDDGLGEPKLTGETKTQEYWLDRLSVRVDEGGNKNADCEVRGYQTGILLGTWRQASIE